MVVAWPSSQGAGLVVWWPGFRSSILYLLDLFSVALSSILQLHSVNSLLICLLPVGIFMYFMFFQSLFLMYLRATGSSINQYCHVSPSLNKVTYLLTYLVTSMLRPGSDAELFMSQTQFKFGLTQINKSMPVNSDAVHFGHSKYISSKASQTACKIHFNNLHIKIGT